MTTDPRDAEIERQRRYEDAIAGAYRGGTEDDRLAARAAMAVADDEVKRIKDYAVRAVEAEARAVRDLEAALAQSEQARRGQQALIEAQRATLDRVRALADEWVTPELDYRGRKRSWWESNSWGEELLAILDAAPEADTAGGAE